MRRAWGICYSLAFYPLLVAYKIVDNFYTV